MTNHVISTFFILLNALLSLNVFANSSGDFPVLYQGRFRPADVYAQLWLDERYHAKKLKSKNLAAFETTDSSALSFLWHLNSKGYFPYKKSPLFWIQLAEIKQLANLPVNRNHFSYDEIFHALYKEPDTAKLIFQRMAVYYFLESNLNLHGKAGPARIEIASLLPGLWLKWEGENIIIDRVPAQSPWNFLVPGELLGNNLRTRGSEILKRDKSFVSELQRLFRNLKDFEQLKGAVSVSEFEYEKQLRHFQSEGISPNEIQKLLEQKFPLIERLKTSGQLFQALPSRHSADEWIPLNSLSLKVYDPKINALKPIKNFTSYSDENFEKIRNAYFDLQSFFLVDSNFLNVSDVSELNKQTNILEEALLEGYTSLAGKVFREAHQKRLDYPSLSQLKIESIYFRFPWVFFLIFLYLTSIFFIVAYEKYPNSLIQKIALFSLVSALLLHSSLLCMRCYILQRPPVSNMFETVIYVPWVAVCITLFIPIFRKQVYALLAACCSAVILLTILELTGLDQRLDQVQAVLDSQFWLLIHVLMVVGSYGIFILGAILGLFYLLFYLFAPRQIQTMSGLAKLILQSIYMGTALLITGTILGGIWAAESWGRFWDWDPKESWAFISACFYLISIHAYRFGKIHDFGLAIGSIIGAFAISFTWYGVNYILGTGLHSYGFGSGGDRFYYAFLLSGLIFLTLVLFVYQFRVKALEKRN